MTRGAATMLVVVAMGCGEDDRPRTTIGDPTGVGGGQDDGDQTDGAPSEDGGGGTAEGDDGDDPPDADSGDAPDGDDDGMIWDVGSNADGGGCADGGAGELSYSYIWVANSPQGTMSKINTETLIEEGRYYVRPDQGGSPSRTSVGLSGDVAVAARSGGMSKFFANTAECAAGDSSSGADDVKPFPDPCLAWHTEFNYSSHRGVAWAPAEWDEASCSYINEKLWSAGVDGVVEVALLDGETGVVEDSVQVPEVGGGVGVYGAAVDSAGNFWGWVPSGSRLLKVDRVTMTPSTWQVPSGGYGITVDHKDRPWLCAGQATRFDPLTETFQSTNSGGGGVTGCMEDGMGTLWIGTGNGISGIDIDAVAVSGKLDAPGFIKGVSVQEDGEGNLFVWGVSQGQNAYKIDPTTNTFETFTGLNSPYTYSDMTGFALGNVTPDPSG